MAVITLPLGDLTSEQARALADVARKYTGDTLRTTADQNMILRWVSEADLPAVYSALERAHLAQTGAGTIADITACPGTDTCKLGISSSRALAAQLTKDLRAAGLDRDPNAKHLHIKTSGCFNSCGQHHVADLGFLGVSRNVGGRRVPHFQLVVGGQWTNNGGSYGLAIGAVPSKRVPEVVKRLTDRYRKERIDGESFADFTSRIGKKTIRALVEEMQKIPSYEQDPEQLQRLGRPSRVHDLRHGRGRVRRRSGPVRRGRAGGRRARALRGAGAARRDARSTAPPRTPSARCCRARGRSTREKNPNVGTSADEIVGEFRKHFYDTELFFDPFAGGRFAHYLFRAHEERRKAPTAETRAPAHRGGDALRRRRAPVLHAARRGASRNSAVPLGPSADGLGEEPWIAQKLQLKIYVTPDSARSLEAEALIPVFHRWIKERILPELLIDVANYGHVPEGPGVVLIGHGSDYSMDEGEGRFGFLHNRKRAGAGPADRLADLARRTLHAASLLERDPTLSGKLRFATNELLFRVNDRLAQQRRDPRGLRPSSRPWRSGSSRARSSWRASAARDSSPCA